jgi:hypothetical protein
MKNILPVNIAPRNVKIGHQLSGENTVHAECLVRNESCKTCARTTSNVEINIFMKNHVFQNLFQNQKYGAIRYLIDREIRPHLILNIQILNSETSNIRIIYG